MGIVKQLTLDRYERGLMVRALYDLWKRMLTENKPTEDIEDLAEGNRMFAANGI